MTTGTLHPRLQEIIEDFGAVPGNDRLQLLLEFSEELPPLPETARVPSRERATEITGIV